MKELSIFIDESGVMTKLNEAKTSVREEGTVSADDLEKELGLA